MVLDNPPSYDSATSPAVKQDPNAHKQLQPAPVPLPQLQQQQQQHPAAYHDEPSSAKTMHHYVHPVTGDRITTIFPPEHPEMICLQQGSHVRRTRFGLIGILAAVFFFPIGIGLCLLDRRVKCERCGRILEDGVSCG